MKRIIYTVAAAAAITLGAVGVAAPAMASNGPAVVKVNTHQNGVADTTFGSSAGDHTKDSPYGPVWAYDNLERKITATQNPDGTWTVVVASQGSYAAFASPIDGNAPIATSGPVSGEVTYLVDAGALVPSGANLSAQSPLSLHSGDLMAALFSGPVQVKSSSYDFTYKLAGQVYEQQG
jgi:hypothetical protein